MNWLDITLLCLAGIGFVKGLFDGIIKQVVSLIALVIAIFFCGKAAAWLKGYILALGWFPEEGVTILSYIAGFILIMGVFILAGELVTKVVGATPLSVINHLFGGFFGLLVVFGLYQFAVERAGVRGSRIGLDSSPIKDRISFLL